MTAVLYRINGITMIAEKIAERLISYAHDNWSGMVDEDGDISIDEDGMVTRELENLLPINGDKIFEQIFNHPAVDSALSEVKIIVRELAEDAMEWHKASQSSYAMLRYHGMSIRDFI